MIVGVTVGVVIPLGVISLTLPPLLPNTPAPNNTPKVKPTRPINPKIPQQKQEGEKQPLFSGKGSDTLWFDIVFLI